MLKIRLQRTGRTNDPSFRIVVLEHTESTKSGSFVERVGTYNPKTKERNLVIDRIKYWLSVGAKASGTVHNMLVSAGVVTGKKVNVLPKKSPPAVQSTAQAGPPKSDQDGSASGGKAEAAEAAPAAEAPTEAASEEAPKVEEKQEAPAA